MARLLERLGRFAVRRKWRMIGIWFGVVVGIAVLNGALGGELANKWSIPGAESQKAGDLLKARFTAFSGGEAQVVFKVTSAGGVRGAAASAAIGDFFTAAATLPHVATVQSPLTPAGARQVSADGTIAYGTIRYDIGPEKVGTDGVGKLQAAATRTTRAAGIQTEFGGVVIQASEKPETGNSEAIGLLAAIVILLIAFGSVVAMGIPIGTAIFALGTGIMSVMVLASVVDVPTVAPILATMIGLGVGIDYSLFIVSRHRQNLATGMDVEASVGLANATAGQAVVFAGGTVVIAILGLWLSGIPSVGAMAYATALVVLVSVIAAVTLLPALLGLAGHKINALRIPGLTPSEKVDTEHSFWGRWSHHVARHPWRYLISSLVFLVALGLPVFSMRLGQNDASTLSKKVTERRAYDLLAAGFGKGFNGPLLIVVDLAPERAAAPAVLSRLAQGITADPDVALVTPPSQNRDGDTAVVTVLPKSAPQDQASTDLVHRIREKVVPRAVSGTPVHAYVGGSNAANVDISDKLSHRLPIFIGAVILVSFLLLMLVFRSVLVPLKAAVLNVLSIGAAYGVVVAIFEWGWGKQLVGLQETLPIVSFIPMLMFAILFGLSMDYEVFILSRVREEYLKTGNNVQSVVTGIATTARVVTSAALIMIAVFSSFLLGDNPIIKMMGVGLAVAVFVDATIVRLVLVPATMELLGDANWWLPRWLDRILPRFDLEQPGAGHPQALDGASTDEEREPELVG